MKCKIYGAKSNINNSNLTNLHISLPSSASAGKQSIFFFSLRELFKRMKTKECNKKIKNMFPEFRELIQQLRADNPHFAHLFEKHEELDQEICLLEQDPVNQINIDIESLKRKKLKLKDEIYRLLRLTQNDTPAV